MYILVYRMEWKFLQSASFVNFCVKFIFWSLKTFFVMVFFTIEYEIYFINLHYKIQNIRTLQY